MASLKLNDHSLDVIKLQLLLNFHMKPCPFLMPTGHFNHATLDAVKQFQKTAQLQVDGVVGKKTWLALGMTRAEPKVTPLQRTKPWLDVAYAEYGIAGDVTPNKHEPRIIEYHKTTTLKATTDETPWCSSFVNWVMIQSGRKGTNNALAKSWLGWGEKISTPQRGDIVVIKKKANGYSHATGSSTGYHVAFYISSTATHINLLGGNQGNRVKESIFPLAKYDIMGYRRPQ